MPAATVTFNSTRAQQTWVVPAGVTSVVVECWGAQGGTFWATSANKGGKGGYAKGTLAVTPGETLYIYVGSTAWWDAASATSQRGWNGGGLGGNVFGEGGGSGGGGTDVRQGGNTLNHRKIVGGGGGGSGDGSPSIGGVGGGTFGGTGGDPSGASGYGGKPGTQTAAGDHTLSSVDHGSFGVGGDKEGGSSAGGGGGGWYGGGSGLYVNGTYKSAGGGGGSGYIDGVTGGTMTADVREGDGLIVLTYNRPPSTPTNLAPSGAQGKNAVTLSATVSDPDGDNVYAQFQYSTDNATWSTINGSTVASGGTSSVAFTGAGNTTYYLRARTIDASGVASDYTASQTFITNRPPGAPGAFVSPTSGEVVNTTDIVEVGAATDPDGQALTYQWDLSLDNGATYTNKRATQAGLSWTYDYTNEAATTTAKWRVRAWDGLTFGGYSYSANFTVQHNQAPTAPTLTAPGNGSVLDIANTNRLDWNFNDPDAGDSQSKYDIEWRKVGATVWTATTVISANTYHDISGGVLTTGDYEWRVRTYDAQGAVSPYSALGYFSAASKPDAPTITSPLNGGTIAVENSQVSWSYPNQEAFQVRVLGDNAGAPNTADVHYDSGSVVNTTARNHALRFPTNGIYVHIQVAVKLNGLWSVFSSVRVLISYTVPPLPAVVLLPDDYSGSIGIVPTFPAPNKLSPDSASFENGVGTWTSAATLASAASGTATDGTKVLSITTPNAVAVGTASATLTSSATTGGVPAAPGQGWTVAVDLAAGSPASAGMEGRVDVQFLDAGGIQTGIIASSRKALTGAMQRFVATGTAPANTVTVRALIRQFGPTAVGDVMLADRAVLRQGGNSEWEPGGGPEVNSYEVHRARRNYKGEWGPLMRIAKDIPPSLAWIDYTPGSGLVYRYAVNAIGDNGTTTMTPEVE